MGDSPDAFNMEELQNLVDHEDIGEIPYWERTDSTREYMRLLEILEKSMVYDQEQKTFGKLDAEDGFTDIIFKIADMQMPYRDILDRVKEVMVQKGLVDGGASMNQILHQLSDFLIHDHSEDDEDKFDIAHEINLGNPFAPIVPSAKAIIRQFVRETIHFHNWLRRARRDGNI